MLPTGGALSAETEGFSAVITVKAAKKTRILGEEPSRLASSFTPAADKSRSTFSWQGTSSPLVHAIVGWWILNSMDSIGNVSEDLPLELLLR